MSFESREMRRDASLALSLEEAHHTTRQRVFGHAIFRWCESTKSASSEHVNFNYWRLQTLAVGHNCHPYARLNTSKTIHPQDPINRSSSLVLLVVEDLLGDTVTILLPLLGDPAATLLLSRLGHVLNDTDLRNTQTKSRPQPLDNSTRPAHPPRTP